MSKKDVAAALADRIASNRRGSPLSDADDDKLLDEYLSKPPTSFRKLAKKHGHSVGTVQRAIHRAAARRQRK